MNKVQFTVSGNSMRPYLKDSEIISINTSFKKSLRLGSIYLVKYNNEFMIHRCIDLAPLTFCGDMSLESEESNTENIIGELDNYRVSIIDKFVVLLSKNKNKFKKIIIYFLMMLKRLMRIF